MRPWMMSSTNRQRGLYAALQRGSRKNCSAPVKNVAVTVDNLASPSYMRCNNCCNAHKEMDMAQAVESFIDRLMGPFARELARMPASSFRYLLNAF